MNLTSLTNIVRALITSRKQPCTMIDILKDFREIENMDLNAAVAKFDFKEAYDFFKSSDEFNLHTVQGTIYISNKPNAKSAHVCKLVRGQKSSKKTSTRLTKPSPPSRRFQNRTPNKKFNSYHYVEGPIPRKPQNFGATEKRNEVTQPCKQERVSNKNSFEEERLKWKLEVDADLLKKLKDENHGLHIQIEELMQEKKRLEELNVLKTSAKNLVTCVESKNYKEFETVHEDDITRAELQEEKQEIAELKQLKENLASVALVSRDANNNMKKLAPDDLRHRLTEKRSEQKVHSEVKEAEDAQSMLRPILGQNTQSVEVSQSTKQTRNLKVIVPIEQNIQRPNNITPNSNTMQKTAQNIEPALPMQQNVQPYPSRVNRFSSVQQRLKVRLNQDTNSREVSNNESEKCISKAPPITYVDEPKVFPSKVPKIPSNQEMTSNQKVYNFDFNLDPCVNIEQYCRAMGFKQPKYTISRTKRGLFYSQITLQNNTTYSTYPMEYPNEISARQNAALKAINQINMLMSRKKLPPFPNESEFLDILYKALKEQPNGIISNKMEDWFAEKFRYSIPKLWFAMVQKSRRFTIEQGVNEHTFIILANPTVQTEEINVLEILREAPNQMKPIQLPWHEKNWNLHITHCVSTVEVWANLLSPDCSDRLDSLTLQIERHMKNKKIRPAVIAVKHIYLVEVHKSYNRVRVETIDKAGETALVFHVDYGNTERLQFNVLYNCPLEFLDLPPQAVPFSLFGLDDFASFPNAAEQLKQKLLNRSFIGEVITKEAEFEVNSNIQMIMFDTSTDDDINMNDLLQEEICRSAPAPQLKQEGFSQVIVTHVDDKNGDVSLQLNMEYVNNTLKRIIESKFSREQHRCTAEELLRKQLLLVHDNNEWFRAKVADEHQVQNLLQGNKQDVDLILIDSNIKRCVNISQIFRLESLSRALSKYPARSIRVKLHNIPEFSHNIICRIRALLPEQCEVRVRVDIPGTVPNVTIFRRVDGPAMPFCNINDDLRLEIEGTKDNILCQKSGSDESTSAKTAGITSPTQLFRSLTLTSEPMLPLNFSELPKLKEYAPLPLLNSIFSVRVCSVSNPMCFMVQPYNNDYAKLLQLQTELQEFCLKQDAYIPTDKVEIDEAYAAKNVDAYYRVIAKARYGKMINVSRCDYGDSCTVRIDHLKVLPLKFRNLPIMGISARLYGIRGSADDIWSSEDVQRFRELVLDKKLSSYVKGIERDKNNSLVFTLDLVNVSEDYDVFIRDILIAEKRVMPK